MAKKKKEEPIVDNEVGKIKVKEKKEQQPVNETKGNITKVKAKMKKPVEDLSKQTITKVDLNQPLKKEENVEKEQDINSASEQDKPVVEEIIETTEEKVVETESPVENQETPIVEEVTGKETQEKTDLEKDILKHDMQTGKALPQEIEKLVFFMEETGGDLSDYLALNQDYSNLDNHTLLKEYYKTTKPHLSDDEIEFVMEDTFAFDEDEDDEREIKRKKLAMKEQVAQAKLHLESAKTKYYEDIKAGSKLTKEQQEAIEYFNKNKEESKVYQNRHDVFINKTEKVFNNNFKGFEYNIGDKKFRFNVKDPAKIKETQSDINNFVEKFLTKDKIMEDAAGYHKGLFTAMNPDQIANHFYEQGKADALKESIAKSKNVNMDPRQAHVENVNTSGLRVRALNDDGPDFKFKIKNKNK